MSSKFDYYLAKKVLAYLKAAAIDILLRSLDIIRFHSEMNLNTIVHFNRQMLWPRWLFSLCLFERIRNIPQFPILSRKSTSTRKEDAAFHMFGCHGIFLFCIFLNPLTIDFIILNLCWFCLVSISDYQISMLMNDIKISKA